MLVKRILTIGITILFTFLCQISAQNHKYARAPGVGKTEYVYYKGKNVEIMNREIIVKLKAGITDAEIQNYLKSIDSSIYYEDEKDGFYIIDIPDNAEYNGLLNKIKQNSIVSYTLPHLVMHAASTTPRDKYYDWQWHLKNTGQAGGPEN